MGPLLVVAALALLAGFSLLWVALWFRSLGKAEIETLTIQINRQGTVYPLRLTKLYLYLLRRGERTGKYRLLSTLPDIRDIWNELLAWLIVGLVILSIPIGLILLIVFLLKHLYVLGIGIFVGSLLIELVLLRFLARPKGASPTAPPRREEDVIARFGGGGFLFYNQYTGQATLPKRIYVGDAKDISLILHLKKRGLLEKQLDIQDTETGKEVSIGIRQPGKKEQFLEVELLAAGCTIAGDPKQRQSLQLETLEFHWNCHFPNSGNLRLSLILKSIHQADERTLGTIYQDVRVNRFDHATQRQVSLLAIVLGIPSFIIALFGAVLIIIQFIHIAGLR